MNKIQLAALGTGASGVALAVLSGHVWAIAIACFAFGVNVAFAYVAIDLRREQ